jgi:hypothetical protein
MQTLIQSCIFQWSLWISYLTVSCLESDWLYHYTIHSDWGIPMDWELLSWSTAWLYWSHNNIGCLPMSHLRRRNISCPLTACPNLVTVSWRIHLALVGLLRCLGLFRRKQWAKLSSWSIWLWWVSFLIGTRPNAFQRLPLNHLDITFL